MFASRQWMLLSFVFYSVTFLLVLTSSPNAQDKIPESRIPEKVAILPFTWAEEANESVKEKHPDALELARRVFSRTFSSTGYDEVPLETVDQLLSPSDIKNENFSALVENGIDGIIMAEIHNIAIGKGGIISRSNAEIDFTMINLKNDKIVWSNKETLSRMGGLLLNSGQLTRAFDSLAVTEDERTIEITNVLLDLYSSVLESLPPADITLEAPKIESIRFVKMEKESPNQPEGFQIWLEGSAGCSAYFDISPEQDYIPFIEYIPGNYFTFYPTEEIPESITIHLENGLGIQANKEVSPSFPEMEREIEDDTEVLP